MHVRRTNSNRAEGDNAFSLLKNAKIDALSILQHAIVLVKSQKRFHFELIQ